MFVVDASAIFMGRANAPFQGYVIRGTDDLRIIILVKSNCGGFGKGRGGGGGGEVFAFAKLVPLAKRKNININSKINSRR